ncbi:MAG: transketolase [Planctomycetota bacterium]|nr:transketolase [Planctomycetota bacterium]
MTSPDKIELLMQRAKAVRRHIIRMIAAAGSGHPGGSLSGADLLVALYFAKLRHDPKNPCLRTRDRFHLSKGHCAPLWYAVLAEAGYFPVETLTSLRKLGSVFQGHPDMKCTPGVEMSSGSLGQGLSVGVGMALASRLDKTGSRVYVMIGDGECQEGQIWEAAMSAAHYKLDNLFAIIDHNNLQIDGPVSEVMAIEPISDKWRAFGWHVLNVDGHDMKAILGAYDEAEKVKGKPTVIIAKTTKGKGVSFMENGVEWHGVAPNAKQAEQALRELA